MKKCSLLLLCFWAFSALSSEVLNNACEENILLDPNFFETAEIAHKALDTKGNSYAHWLLTRKDIDFLTNTLHLGWQDPNVTNKMGANLLHTAVYYSQLNNENKFIEILGDILYNRYRSNFASSNNKLFDEEPSFNAAIESLKKGRVKLMDEEFSPLDLAAAIAQPNTLEKLMNIFNYPKNTHNFTRMVYFARKFSNETMENFLINAAKSYM